MAAYQVVAADRLRRRLIAKALATLLSGFGACLALASVSGFALSAKACENPRMSSSIDIRGLSAEERLALLGDLWDSLAPEEIPLTEAQRTELDRRLDDLEADSDLGIPWEEVLRRIRGRSK